MRCCADCTDAGACMKKRLFCLPLLMLVLFACENPAGPSTPSGGALKAKVQFDSTLKCRNNTTNELINSGTEVKEQDWLAFYAQLSGDTVVDKWYLNDAEVKTGGTSYSVTVGDSVVVEESGQKFIKVRYTVKKIPLKAKVQFDSTLKCYNSTTSGYIESGTEVKEQDSLIFEAQLSGDTVVDKWYRNDAEKQTGGTSYSFTVGDYSVVEEGEQKLIKVRYTTKTPLKAKVQFDSTLKCRNNTTNELINSGTEVKEQDWLAFYAQLSGDTVVDKWYLNDAEVQTGGTGYSVRVRGSVVVEEGGQKLIKVRCTFK